MPHLSPMSQRSGKGVLKIKELGIYIHIPFCKQKCYYCDFISYEKKEDNIKEYIEALKKEIKQEANKKEYEITTIYIGGGTPSLMEASYIEEIITTIKEHYNVVATAEITIEMNPGTVDKEKLLAYQKVGINRVSIGLQSTNNQRLKQIGRIHTYEEFLTCYHLAREVGIKNINVDLMLGLPNQTLEELQSSIHQVISLQPEHISLYSLIVEEHTKMQKMIEEKQVTLPEEELERTMYWEAKKILEENGYFHYEISNFAKIGYESKHNTNCWLQKEYLGFGVAAHSYFQNKRYCNTTSLKEYCKNIEEGNFTKNRIVCEIQTEEEKKKEYMLLGLRMLEGVNIQEFKNKFIENPIYVFHKELEKLVKQELVEIDLNQIKLTKKGLDLANLVWEEFV